MNFYQYNWGESKNEMRAHANFQHFQSIEHEKLIIEDILYRGQKYICIINEEPILLMCV